MDATWIISANASRARFFSQAHHDSPLEEFNDMINEAARLRAADLETDHLGRRSASKSRHGAGTVNPPSGFEPRQMPAEHETQLFARAVADLALQGHREGRFRRLVLVASPEFLGLLRKELDPELERNLRLSINKDYTQLSPDRLREEIEAHAAEV